MDQRLIRREHCGGWGRGGTRPAILWRHRSRGWALRWRKLRARCHIAMPCGRRHATGQLGFRNCWPTSRPPGPLLAGTSTTWRLTRLFRPNAYSYDFFSATLQKNFLLFIPFCFANVFWGLLCKIRLVVPFLEEYIFTGFRQPVNGEVFDRMPVAKRQHLGKRTLW